MATRRQQQTRRVGAKRIVVDESWRERIHQPKITDPKRRREAIEHATSLIKTTATIDTVSLGRD
jgi:hypothetical protein